VYPRSSLPSFTDVRCRLPLSVAVAPPPPPSERWRVKGRRMFHSDRATGSNRLRQRVVSLARATRSCSPLAAVGNSDVGSECRTTNGLSVFARETPAKRHTPRHDPRSALVRFSLRYRKKRVIAIPGAGRNCVRAQLTKSFFPSARRLLWPLSANVLLSPPCGVAPITRLSSQIKQIVRRIAMNRLMSE